MKGKIKKYYTPVAIREMTCQICGKKFLAKIKRKYCGKVCQNKASYKRTIVIMKKKCPICGCGFERLSGCNALGTRTKYCSRECRLKYQNREKYEKVCCVCGKEFISKNITKKTCSKTCTGVLLGSYITGRHTPESIKTNRVMRRRRQEAKDRARLSNREIKRRIYVLYGLQIKEIQGEFIELKRQQIIMKRTLKEFKQWRKENENESNHTDVHGKQFTDEENHEGRV